LSCYALTVKFTSRPLSIKRWWIQSAEHRWRRYYERITRLSILTTVC